MTTKLDWSVQKNALLKEKRGVSFEDVEEGIRNGYVLDDYAHPNQADYKGQRILVLPIQGYVHLVPYVTKDDGSIFLKTIIPSRNAHKKYKLNDDD